MKQPPADQAVEAKAIGIALAYQETLPDFCKLAADDFYNDAHKAMYQAIVALYREHGKVEPLRLNHALKKQHGIDGQKVIGYQMAVYSPNDMEFCTQRLREMAIRRAFRYAGMKMAEEAGNEDADMELLAQKAAAFLDMASVQKGQEPEHWGDILARRLESYINGTFVRGIGTGLQPLDDVWSGFYPAELTVLAARPSMGKTTFAQRLASHVAAQTKKAVLIFSLEMKREYLADRYLAGMMGVNLDDLRRGCIPKPVLVGSKGTINAQGKLPLYIDDANEVTTFDILSKARQIKRKTGGLGLLVVDFLTLVADSKGKGVNEHHRINDISRKLRAIGSDLDVPILLLAQLNRQVENRDNKRPRMSDLRESGGIEEAADSIMLLHREEYYNPDTPDYKLVEVIIAKNKQGPRGLVKLYYDASTGEFDHPARRDLPKEWGKNAQQPGKAVTGQGSDSGVVQGRIDVGQPANKTH